MGAAKVLRVLVLGLELSTGAAGTNGRAGAVTPSTLSLIKPTPGHTPDRKRTAEEQVSLTSMVANERALTRGEVGWRLFRTNTEVASW